MGLPPSGDIGQPLNPKQFLLMSSLVIGGCLVWVLALLKFLEILGIMK